MTKHFLDFPDTEWGKRNWAAFYTILHIPRGQTQLKPPVPGSTPGNRLSSDVMGLFKTHINFYRVLLQTVSGCYAHSLF